MRTEQKTAVKNSIGRLVFVALSVLLQVIWICVQAMKLNRYSTWISVATSVLTLVVVILLYGRRTNAAFKMPWIILILAFPVLGPVSYTHLDVYKRQAEKLFENTREAGGK